MGNELKGQKGEKGKTNNNDFDFVPPQNIMKDIWSKFKETKVLGEGASCSVSLVTDRKSKEKFALKMMKKDDKWNPILFKQEVHYLSTLHGHDNILEYSDAFIDDKYFLITTGLLTGGELFDRIKDLKSFPEDLAAETMRMLISAINHCHTRNIVHRDLKPENIVYKTEEHRSVTIIDFGDAKEVQEDEVYDDFVGTAFYLAPEVVRQRKGWELKASDMWTLGVICYVLVTGRPPFWGRDNREILTKILKGKLAFPKKEPRLKTHKAVHQIVNCKGPRQASHLQSGPQAHVAGRRWRRCPRL